MLGSSIILPATSPVICPCGDAGLTPEWLKNELVSIYGAILIGLYIGEDLLGSSTATSWPGRVGPTLPNTGSTAFNLSLLNGRRCIVGNTLGTQQLGYNDAGFLAKTTLAVYQAGTDLVAYQTIAGGYPSTQTAMLMRQADATTFFESSGRAPHYVNGILTSNFPTVNVPSVVEGVFDTNTLETGIGVGGNNAIANRSGNSKTATVVFLSAPQTPVQRAKAVVALKRYYNLIITADELKVASLPVDNPVVVAPLRTAFQSYGTVNSAFTLIGTPTIGAEGLTTDATSGINLSGLTATTAFTLVARARLVSLASNAYGTFLSAYLRNAAPSYGLGVKDSNTTHKFGYLAYSVTDVLSSVDSDTNWHTFTLIRTSTPLTSLYLDGTLICSGAAGISDGPLVIIGYGAEGAGTKYFTPCNVRNFAIYAASASASERALLEAWVAAP